MTAALPLFEAAERRGYPDTPGHNFRPTSVAAAASMEREAPKLAGQILNLIRQYPRTCWEVENTTGLSHQTASARIRELNLKGLIRDSGQRRATGSGRKAIVWMAAA